MTKEEIREAAQIEVNKNTGLTESGMYLAVQYFESGASWANSQDEWIEIKEGCEMPEYDAPVLWLCENSEMVIEALDKDGNPWLFEDNEDTRFFGSKATHWRYLPTPPTNKK